MNDRQGEFTDFITIDKKSKKNTKNSNETERQYRLEPQIKHLYKKVE